MSKSDEKSDRVRRTKLYYKDVQQHEVELFLCAEEGTQLVDINAMMVRFTQTFTNMADGCYYFAKLKSYFKTWASERLQLLIGRKNG